MLPARYDDDDDDDINITKFLKYCCQFPIFIIIDQLWLEQTLDTV